MSVESKLSFGSCVYQATYVRSSKHYSSPSKLNYVVCSAHMCHIIRSIAVVFTEVSLTDHFYNSDISLGPEIGSPRYGYTISGNSDQSAYRLAVSSASA